MVKIRKVSASLIDEPQARAREVSPREQARQKGEGQLRDFVQRLSSLDQSFYLPVPHI
jgi:hypothetical protein